MNKKQTLNLKLRERFRRMVLDGDGNSDGNGDDGGENGVCCC